MQIGKMRVVPRLLGNDFILIRKISAYLTANAGVCLIASGLPRHREHLTARDLSEAKVSAVCDFKEPRRLGRRVAARHTT